MSNSYKHSDGTKEWIDYCYEIINENPYSAQMADNMPFDKHLELAVKSKIYHTAIYEYKLMLDKKYREELEAEAAAAVEE